MKKLTAYIDTSVIGGCFDPEFEEWSVALIEDFKKGRYIAVLSDVIAKEVSPAPAFVQDLHSELLALPAEVVHVGEDTISLVQNYIAHSVLSQRFMNDMLHIAS